MKHLNVRKKPIIDQILRKYKLVQYLEKLTFLHRATVSKKVLEWAFYRIETIKI